MLVPKVNVHYLDACKKHLLVLYQKMFLNFRATSILYEYDLFFYMVYMTMSLHLMNVNHPNEVLIPGCNLFMRRSVYRFLLTHVINLHVTQVLLKMAQEIASKEDQPMAVDDELSSTCVDEPECKSSPSPDKRDLTVLDILHLVLVKCELKLAPGSVTLSRVLSRLEVCLVPWLRSCALFFKAFLMAGPVPKKLQDDDNNLELLCQYLGIPSNIEELVKPLELSLLQTTTLTPFVSSMCEAMRCELAQNRVQVNVSYPLEPMQLIPLPRDYTHLINQPLKMCPTTNSVMKYPAICMICGEVVCSGSYCCQIEDPETNSIKGPSMNHLEKCTGSAGMFLRPMECKMMLISSSGKGCFFGAPYVDEYGEQDTGLRRGNPMYLNEEMMDNLRRIWYSQNISETVSRQLMNSSLRMLAFDWNEM